MKPEREGVVFGLMTPEEQKEIREAGMDGREYYAPRIGWVKDNTELIERGCAYRLKPKPLPRLTLEWIEQHGGWPEGAKIAVVSNDGSAFWGSYNNAKMLVDYTVEYMTCWVGIGDGLWISIAYCGFDATDWQNSLIRRPEPVKKYRPWTPEEAVGKVVSTKIGDDYALIIRASDGYFCLGPSRVISAKELLDQYTCNGSPCGVEETV